MTKLFISHSSQDDAFVRDLRAALADQGQHTWIDSRELRGGDPLWPEIQKAIEAASAYAVVVSPNAFQSKWLAKELRYALTVRDRRGKGAFRIITLSLNGTKLGVLEEFFSEEPIYIPVSTDAGGVEAAINPLLIAVGKRLPADVPETLQPKTQPLEELVLELSDLRFHEQDGVRRASARAALIYEPATLGQREVSNVQSWRLIAPIGPIEADELRWYLEKYAIWPSHYFTDRAQNVEKNLVEWGQILHKAAMPKEQTGNVMNAWAKIDDHAGRRFSVYVNTILEDGAPDADVKAAREVATLLLAQPWELLHDSISYLFQGAKPVSVRRRLPNTRVLDVPVVATPIRILLVTARPEDDMCSYIDHRASALPLVEAMESLPGLVKLHVLSPPTLQALRAELERARNQKKPYHVVHFDGHGMFNREVGLGGLCFEKPEDTGKLEKRGHVTVFTNELGPLLRDHRIPLVFLEACQTAQAEKASESVASELLKVGVASVVAMSHSVLVETARRFVGAFYEALADGKRVGDAMLAGQRYLKDDTFRGRILGAGELRLEDWFVPVLYQEKDDPQLFKITPAKQTREDFQAALVARLGDLPSVPETGFIGRSRELLALQRLLREERYAVVRGQGGEGKTALGAEFAQWTVRSQQIRRAAFVSMETHGNERAVIDALGKQLVQKDFSAAGDLNEAVMQVERALREQPTLLVIDNMESILLPPFIAKETPTALSEEAAEEAKAILLLCERLLKVGDTRVIFTTREALPPPFDGLRHRRELLQLDREDAVKLVERVLNVAGGNNGASSDAAREEIEQLVMAVHCHARTLVLLAPSLQKNGVAGTRELLVKLMNEMEKTFPRSREKSVFASVELSLRRMSQENRKRCRVLGVFHGGVELNVLRAMMQWEEADVAALRDELVGTGLATLNRYNHLTLNPALCPYLRVQMEPAETESLTAHWVDVMGSYLEFLRQQQSKNIKLVATLTLLELPNLFALLELVQLTKDAEATIAVTTSLYELLQHLGKPRLLKQIGQIRDAATSTLGGAWNHTQFNALRTHIEQLLGSGLLRETLEAALKLHQRVKEAGEQAYPGADYDLAMACNLLGDVLPHVGESELALSLLEEARERFGIIDMKRPGGKAANMVSVCLARKGDCLLLLGRLEEAAATYEESILRSRELNDERQVAAAKNQLGSVRKLQRRYSEALAAHAEARERFTQLNEPESVAVTWYQIGNVYQRADEQENAEDAYREALAIYVRLGNVNRQASTLMELANSYLIFGRTEESVPLYQQAVDKFVEVLNVVSEGNARSNLAVAFRKLGRLDEAHQEIRHSIKCGQSLGHSTEPWKAWSILFDIETDAANASGAAEAKQTAIACYLAYRRDGGENNNTPGRISLGVTKRLLADDADTAAFFLQQFAEHPKTRVLLSTFIRTLQAIVDGSRDRTLAAAPDLDYEMAAEILLLIETLEKREC